MTKAIESMNRRMWHDRWIERLTKAILLLQQGGLATYHSWDMWRDAATTVIGERSDGTLKGRQPKHA